MIKGNKDILQILSDAVSEGIIVVDENQYIVSSNSSADTMFGYEAKELNGKFLSILIHDNYHAKHSTFFQSFFSNGEKRKSHGRELFGLKKNGEQFPVEIGLNPFSVYGKTYVMALVVDITERQANEKNLTLRSMALQSASNGIVISDALAKDNPIIYFNPAFQSLTGYDSEEILGTNCRFLQSEDRDQEGIINMRNAIKKGESCQAILKNYKKDGTMFWNDVSVTPIKDKRGVVTHYIGIQNDITERKQLEDERNYLSKIFDDSLNEIYVFDKKTLKFINVNYGARKNMGYTLDELKEMTPVDILPDFTNKKFKNLLGSLVKNIDQKIEFEAIHQRKNGSTYPVFVNVEMAVFGDREVFIAIILDITEQRNYTKELEDTVALRTAQLEKALEKEKELNQLKTKFLTLVSHEFKTPLSTILTSTILLSKYSSQIQEEKRDKHIKTIKDKVEYLDNILNDFLSIEKLETGKVNYKISTFMLSKVLNEVIYNANMILKTGQQIKYPENIEDISLTQDQKIIELALSNLVHNAIKYSSEHTVVDIDIKQGASDTTFVIKDCGIGIPEKDQKNIFNRYFRAENAITIQGTGIGLNIIKSHIENLGGAISFKSKENEGSSFKFSIPNKAS